jgi:transposase
MRLGLRGTVRRVLAPRGVKVVQKVQLVYAWTYLLLAVDPLRGHIRWRWIERMNTEHLLPVLRQWKLRCVVWDGAPAHRAQALSELEMVRIRQPGYSPELNPAERVFEEVRRAVEGEVYASLEAKQQAAEVYLRALAADPDRVRQLCGWEWLRTALDALPPRSHPLSRSVPPL